MKRLYTYGYTGGTIDDLQEYIAAGAFILDIRYSPNGRNPIWRKEHLEAVLGAEYVWVHRLGNRAYRSGGPIRIVDLEGGLAILQDFLAESPVVLLCACPDVDSCHRALVAREAAKRLPLLEIRHLAPGEGL